MKEPEAGSDPASQSTTAVKDKDEYIINGTKRFITSGENGKVVLVTAKTDEIVGTCADENCDLIIMGCKHQGFLEKTMSIDIVKSVLKRSIIPVFIENRQENP